MHGILRINSLKEWILKIQNAKEKLHAYIKGISEKYCVLYSAMSLNIRYYIPLPKKRKRDSL